MAKRPKLAPITESGSGSVNEKEKARLAEIIERVNGLFEGEITDDDQLVYVNNVLKGKLLESQELVTQAGNNTKAQFANSPTLSHEILNAVMDALAAHSTMSKQALESERVREGLKEVLLGPAGLYEALRERAGEHPGLGEGFAAREFACFRGEGDGASAWWSDPRDCAIPDRQWGESVGIFVGRNIILIKIE